MTREQDQYRLMLSRVNGMDLFARRMEILRIFISIYLMRIRLGLSSISRNILLLPR